MDEDGVVVVVAEGSGKGGEDEAAPMCLSDLRKGISVCGDSGHAAGDRPKWLDPSVYDPDNIKRFFNDNMFSIVFAWHVSLVVGFNLPELLEPLVYTGNSSTAKKSLARYMNTGKFLMQWHEGDIFDCQTDAFKATQSVRAFHAAVSSKMDKDPSLPQGHKWINAYDMSLVQTGFMGGITNYPQMCGLRVPKEKIAEYISFWRCVGYQLGVPDSFNLCGGGYADASNIVKEVITKVLLPDADHPVADVAPISKAYVDGLNLLFCGFPVFSVPSTLAYAFYGLGHRPYPKMTCLDWLRFFAMRLFISLVKILPKPVHNPLNWATRKVVTNSLKKWESDASESLFPVDFRGFPASKSSGDDSYGGCPASGLLRRRRQCSAPERFLGPNTARSHPQSECCCSNALDVARSAVIVLYLVFLGAYFFHCSHHIVIMEKNA